MILVDYGFNLSATQRIAEVSGNESEIDRVFWSVQTAKLCLATIATAVCFFSAMFVPQFESLSTVLIASCPVLIGTVLFPQWLFQGLQKMMTITICAISARLLSLPLIFTQITSTHDTWLVALIQSGVSIVAGLVACIWIWKENMIRWYCPTLKNIIEVLKDGWHLFVSSAAISLYTTINPIVLGIYSTHTQLGLFSAADKIRQASQSITTSFSMAFYPKISALFLNERSAALILLKKVLLYQGVATLFVSSGIWLTAPLTVSLVMGEGYESAIDVLRILAPVPFLIGISNIFGIQTMLPLGFKKQFSQVLVVSGIINVSLLALLVPVWGAVGAATSVLITEGAVVIIMFVVLKINGINLLLTRSQG